MILQRLLLENFKQYATLDLSFREGLIGIIGKNGSATAVNGVVSQLIGMDKDAFTRSIFSGQKELGILSNTRGEERKKMVRKMIGLDNLDQIQKLVREDRNILKNSVKGQQALLLGTDDLKTINTKIKELEKEHKAIQKKLRSDQQKLDKKNTAYQEAKKAFNLQLKAFEAYNLKNTEQTRFLSLLDGIKADNLRLQKELTTLNSLKKEPS